MRKPDNSGSDLYEDIYERGFSFGKNWQSFLKGLTDEKIETARKSLTGFTGLSDFRGKTFIDVGCGSGIFSLGAYQAGAEKVTSVDVDRFSIECAEYLRKKYQAPPERWAVEKGSALGSEFLNGLEKHDIVYSWGVLHHTGDMWRSLDNVAGLVTGGGLLYIAIYNDYRGFPSSGTWLKIKKAYSKRGAAARKIMEIMYAAFYLTLFAAKGGNPVKHVRNYEKEGGRGMGFYSDCVDWLGGYPYEYATADEIKNHIENKGFALKNLKETNRDGCNEFLFEKL